MSSRGGDPTRARPLARATRGHPAPDSMSALFEPLSGPVPRDLCYNESIIQSIHRLTKSMYAESEVFVIHALIFVGLIVFASVVASKISDHLGAPMLLAFIFLGMLIGEEGLGGVAFDNFSLANKLCSIALILIMFYGGFGTNWKAARPVAAKAAVLASLGVILTALVTGVFCFYVLKFPLLEAFLLGSVIASTDAASVFSILRGRSLSLKERTDSLLEMESGSNDPFSYMMTMIFIALMKDGITAGAAIGMLLVQVGIGLLVGVVLACLMVFLLKLNIFDMSGMNEALLVALALLGYALPEFLGGNGYLSVYLIGIIIGNQDFKNKRSLVSFFDGLNVLAQIAVFFLLGLLASPSGVIAVMLPGLAIMLFMTVIGRPVAVFSLLTLCRRPQPSSTGQKAVVSWAGIRGAASIVFAIMAMSSGVNLTYDLFHYVFSIVLFSLFIQGGLLPTVAKKTGMYEPDGSVLMTFNDFEADRSIQYVTTEVGEDSPFVNRRLSEIVLPKDIRVILIERDGVQFVPDGNSLFKAGDIAVMCGLQYNTDSGQITLTQRTLLPHDDEVGKAIKDLDLSDGRRIQVIERNDGLVIPTGDVVLNEGDVIVFNLESSQPTRGEFRFSVKDWLRERFTRKQGN